MQHRIDKYLEPTIKVVYLNSSRSLCETSPEPGGSEEISYEDWTLN
ncbi:MAG: hypothetical protein KBS95_04595 [Alistipes sp.]|nr:hypothetical protein [Candidatus Alistipes equi]